MITQNDNVERIGELIGNYEREGRGWRSAIINSSCYMKEIF